MGISVVHDYFIGGQINKNHWGGEYKLLRLTVWLCQLSKVRKVFSPSLISVWSDSPRLLRPHTPDLCSFFLISRNPSEKRTPPEMTEVTPLQSDPGPDLEALRSTRCTAPSLENRILTQASSFLLQPPSWMSLTSSCPALSPSSLSSTASSSPLLSTSSTLLSSSLLSTENTQLKCRLLTTSSLCSSQPLSSLLQATAPPTGPEAQKRLSGKDGEMKSEEDESCSSDGFPSYSEELNEVRLFPRHQL